MQNNIRNTNLRFNLDKEQQRRAWEYLQTMDRQDFKSYSQVISLALVDYFDRYYRTQADPYIEALAEVLHKSQMTIKTALAVLEKQELIFRKRQGPGQPNRIYVKLPKETIHYTDRFLSLRQTENCPIDRQDSFPDTDRKLSGNKKEIKKNNLEKRE